MRFERGVGHLRSNAVAYLALFVALGGTSAYAASKIGSKQIKANAVQSKHIASSAVQSSEIAPGAVGAAAISPAAVGAAQLADPPLEIAFSKPGSVDPATEVVNNAGLILTARCTGPPEEPILSVNARGAGTLFLSSTFDDERTAIQDEPVVRRIESVPPPPTEAFVFAVSSDSVNSTVQTSIEAGTMTHVNGGDRQSIVFGAATDASTDPTESRCTLDGTVTQTP